MAPRYASKWVTFAASAFIQACAGLAYSFSVYAPALKDRLSLSQIEIATVGSAVNLGGYFAILAGSIYDCLKDEHVLGPRLVVFLGSLCCACGYLGLYLLASGAVEGNFVHLLLFAACAGNAGVWYDTSALVTNVRNFPNDRGFVVGILKSFLGLSASIYTSIYMAAFAPDAVTFLLMLAIVPPVLCMVLSFFMNYVPFIEASEELHRGSWLSTEGRFLMSYFLVAAIALYQMASAAVEGHADLETDTKQIITGGLLSLLFLVTLLPCHSGGFWAVYSRDYGVGGSSCGSDTGSRMRRASQDEDDEEAAFQARASAVEPRTVVGRPGRSQQVYQLQQQEHNHHQHLQEQLQQQGQLGGAAPRVGSSSSSSLKGLARPGRAAAKTTLVHREPVGEHSEGLPLLPGGAPPGDPVGPLERGGREEGKTLGLVSSSSRGGRSPSDPREPSPSVGAAAHRLGDNASTRRMLGTLDFWCYFLQFMVATGVCLSFLNNLGQLVVALGGSHEGHVVFVSLFSVANAAGRLLMGYIPEQWLHTRGTPRTYWLVVVAVMTTLLSLLAAYTSLNGLYPVSLLMGLTFGGHWSLLPSITSDVFGLLHFAANYTTLQFAPAGGSYLLATRLTGFLYDKAAAAEGDPHQCLGEGCFRSAFLVQAGLSVVSCLGCCLAAVRSRRLYRHIAKHLHEAEAPSGALAS